MNEIRMEIRGIKELEASITKMAGKFDIASRKIVEQGGILVSNEAKKRFRAANQTSLPIPDRPTSRTGNLMKSIDTDHARYEGAGRWSSRTGPTMKYGRRVELGYSGGGGGRGHQATRPFPYLAPGFVNARPKLIDLYRNTWRTAIL
jgi:hypothetical protein